MHLINTRTSLFLLCATLILASVFWLVDNPVMQFIGVIMIIGVVAGHLYQGQILSGTCTRVSDGDTITFVDRWGHKHTVRLAGIDAPEKKQNYGIKSLLALDEQISNKSIEVRRVGKDRYGRMVGVVYRRRRNMNLWMLERGHAWYYGDYNKFLTLGGKGRWKAAEANARKRRIGLWRHSGPENPAAWRKRH